MELKYYIFIAVLLLSELPPITLFYLNYRKKKESKMLLLFFWLLTHFLTDLTATIVMFWDLMSTLPLFVVSTFIETIIFIKYAQLYLNWETSIWRGLYLLTSVVFIAEVCAHGTLDFNSFYINMNYQSLATVLLLFISFKSTRSKSDLRMNQLLLVYHVTIFFYIANLDFLRKSEALMDQVYPFFLSVVLLFLLLLSIHLYTNLRSKNAH
jgi:hypothetical protein